MNLLNGLLEFLSFYLLNVLYFFALPNSLFDSQEGTLDSNLYEALVVFYLETHK